MHGSNRFQVLIQDRLDCATSLVQVSPNASGESYIVWSIDIHDQIGGARETLTREDQNSLDDHKTIMLNRFCVRGSRMRCKVIHRQFSSLTAQNHLDMILEERRIQGIRMVEIEAPRMRNIAVVAIMGDE
jgi:hypothetical protein